MDGTVEIVMVAESDACPACAWGKMVAAGKPGETFCPRCGFVVDWNSSQAFSEIDRFKDRLAVSDAVTEKAANTCWKALGMGFVRGTPVSTLIASSLYAACRHTGTPCTLRDVGGVTGVKRKDIARCYRHLAREMDIKVPVAYSVRCIAEIADKIGVGDRTGKMAAAILEIAQQNGISAGKDPVGLAAAALYTACAKRGENKTLRDVAMAANVAETTVRNKYKMLRKSLRI